MPTAHHTIEMRAPSQVVMATITDFGAYPSFLPDIESAEILRQGDGEWEVRFTLRLIRQLVYTLKLTQVGPTLLRWTLLEGAFRANAGRWELTPLAEDLTRADYHIDVSVGMYVPGNIVRSLVDRGLPETLSRFKAEAERRARL